MAVTYTNYVNLTIGTVNNQTLTIPDGFEGCSIINHGPVNAIVTAADGSTMPILADGGSFDLGNNGRGYKGLTIVGTGTVLYYSILGITRNTLTIA